MALLSDLLRLVADAALGAWLGAMAFFSFVVAPTAFDVLDDEDAGTAVNAVFPTYYAVGVALGGVAIVALAGLWAVATAAPFAVSLTAFAAAAFAYSRWVLVPRMEAAGDDAFATYHRRSVALNATAMATVAGALVATHL